jgi:thermitase
MDVAPDAGAWIGQGVTVALLDTGYSENDAVRCSLAPGYDFVGDEGDTSDVARGVDSNMDGRNDSMAGHGTFLAGIVSLVAPRSSIMPVRVLDSDGQGTSFNVAAGIYFAAANGARVINLSMSFDWESSVVSDAIDFARSHGALVVASVGNGGAHEATYPASLPGTLAVAATTLLDRKAAFSNFGSYVDIAATGTSIISTLPGGSFGSGSGTSFSAACVSGAAAALFSTMEGAGPDDVRSRLLKTAVRVPGTGGDYTGEMGSGRLSVYRALSPTISVGTPTK